MKNIILGTMIAMAGVMAAAGQSTELLNVSYDPTRELYTDFNEAFVKCWKGKSGKDVTVSQSHGGSGKQARAIITPALSILAEPPVTVVDKVVDKRGTRELATAYLEYLYSDVGQDIIGRNFYRPTSESARAIYAKQFPALELVTIDGQFGGWPKAQKAFFADGGIFDQIYQPTTTK